MGRAKKIKLDKNSLEGSFLKTEGLYNTYFECLFNWKASRELTTFFKNQSLISSKKNVNSSIGRNINMLVHNNWVDKSKKKLTHFEEKEKPIRKNLTVPCYKSNINLFLDYFKINQTNGIFFSLRTELALHLFFELDEIREDFEIDQLMRDFKKNFDIYSTFLKIIDESLIFNWLFLLDEVYPNLDKEIDEYIINYLKTKKVKSMIDKFLALDEYNFKYRERVVEEYDLLWNKLLKDGVFYNVYLIEAAELLKEVYLFANLQESLNYVFKKLKVKFFSYLIYDKGIFFEVSHNFASLSTRALIESKNEGWYADSKNLIDMNDNIEDDFEYLTDFRLYKPNK